MLHDILICSLINAAYKYGVEDGKREAMNAAVHQLDKADEPTDKPNGWEGRYP